MERSMKETINLHFHHIEADRLIRVDASGRVDLAASLKMAREIAAFHDADAAQLPVLLDARSLQGRLTIVDIVELVKTLVAGSARHKRKLALLVRNDDQQERARFLHLYSRNRGIPIDAFTDYETAVKWLQAP